MLVPYVAAGTLAATIIYATDWFEWLEPLLVAVSAAVGIVSAWRTRTTNLWLLLIVGFTIPAVGSALAADPVTISSILRTIGESFTLCVWGGIAALVSGRLVAFRYGPLTDINTTLKPFVSWLGTTDDVAEKLARSIVLITGVITAVSGLVTALANIGKG